MIRRNVFSSVLLFTALALLAGCVHPLDRKLDHKLAAQMVTNNRAYLKAMRRAEEIAISRPPSQVLEELEDRLDELEKISGSTANEAEQIGLGPDLMGDVKIKSVAMSLQRVLKLATENNLSGKLARLVPAVRDSQLVQAEAVFDATYFANFNLQKQDTPQPATQLGLDQFGSVQQDTRALETGIRKILTTGGQISVSTTFTRNRRDPSFFVERTFYEADVLASLQQPLLRNFGADVTTSQIELSNNARDRAMSDLKLTLMNTLANTERVYWELVFAYQALLANQRLNREAEEALRKIIERSIYDASSVEVSQQRAFSAETKFTLYNAQDAVRRASDQLKALIYSSKWSVVGEELIRPLDTMADVPIHFNLYDACLTALQNRPDVQQALVDIKDSSIRQRVADNQRLPLLDLQAQVTYQGISTSRRTDSYDALDDGKFIDYILALVFEMPIGNRSAEAAHKQRKIERIGAVINYRRTAQNAMLEVKSAIRQLQTGYRQIGVARDARLASADTVRALRERVKAGATTDPGFIDFKIRREREMTLDEIAEIRSLADYNIAISQYYLVIGTLLARDGIEMVAEGRD